MEKVTVTKEMADSIHDLMLDFDDDKYEVVRYIVSDSRIEYGAEENMTMVTAVLNGYEIEKTSEEKVAAYYEELREEYEQDCMVVVQNTLNLLGIKIEGVNA